MNKITVGPISKGLKTDRLPFVIDNDSFPVLINAYQWRGRVKRKRGTSLLNRLSRYFDSTSTAFSDIPSIVLSGGTAILSTGFSLQQGLQIVPGTVVINDITAGNTYTDVGGSNFGELVGVGGGAINYINGRIILFSGANHTITASFLYYPNLPVMGLEEFNLVNNTLTGTLAFDPTYAYNISASSPYNITAVNFYKNPSDGTYPGYISKSVFTPLTWNGQDYQQFWSTNYQNAFWVTNGVTTPFSPTNIGMQFKPILTVTVGSGGPPALANLQIISHGLVVGDFVFINEVSTTTGINFQTGYVTVVLDADNITVEFPNATITTNGTGGIAQYLTNRSDTTKDCIRWYDGDPTTSVSPTVFVKAKGWVNFMPPLSRLDFSITDLPAAQYYLVGARLIQEFKDRLLFIGPVVQTSDVGANPIYLQDTVVFSQNGTPFYTVSFTGDPTLATTTYNPILLPTNQTGTASAWWEDQTGFGGFISTGTNEIITSCASNEDVLILGTTGFQTRFVYTGNDLLPFNFYEIDSELTTDSTFSVINMGKGVISRGNRGFIMTTQREANRIDLEILDQEFEISTEKNGAERFTAIRDFENEWIYFTYRSNDSENKFPDQTLQFNYRDNSWAIFNESYTTYGQFRKDTGYTWATLPYRSWTSWNIPWNSAEGNILRPQVIAGNQQGFVFFRDQGTNEDPSLNIFNVTFNGAGTVVTRIDSLNHGLDEGDYIIATSEIFLNDTIVQVVAPVTLNSFGVKPPIPVDVLSPYRGDGLITRMYVPFIQTKQFPTYWDQGKKTRIGVQQYLLSTTPSGQIQLLIFLSQNDAFAYNSGNIVPSSSILNNSLVYSTTLFTCLESINLGLTPANTNLLMISDNKGTTGSQQLWHRINTSLIGDTVQIGFTLSDAQMRDPDFNNQFAEIELHGFILNVSPSQMLS